MIKYLCNCACVQIGPRAFVLQRQHDGKFVQEAELTAVPKTRQEREQRRKVLEQISGKIGPVHLSIKFHRVTELSYNFVQFPVVVKEQAPVSSIHFSATSPHDFAVTSGSRVSSRHHVMIVLPHDPSVVSKIMVTKC